MIGIPINSLSRRLCHHSIQTTLIYLELVPDPMMSLAMMSAYKGVQLTLRTVPHKIFMCY